VFLTRYLREAREELKKVSWPRWLETRNNTLLVIGISVFLAALLGLADILFSNGLQYLLTLNK
jgi:preprotein translocase SecE subunit